MDLFAFELSVKILEREDGIEPPLIIASIRRPRFVHAVSGSLFSISHQRVCRHNNTSNGFVQRLFDCNFVSWEFVETQYLVFVLVPPIRLAQFIQSAARDIVELFNWITPANAENGR